MVEKAENAREGESDKRSKALKTVGHPTLSHEPISGFYILAVDE